MVSNRCALCLICLASLVAFSRQDLFNHRKRAELMQETYLQDHQITNRNVRQNKFWSGSRYGRAGHDGPQLRVEVEPRGDRFFMGSRYGKRSGTWLETGEAIPIQTDTVTCLYTGIDNLFHCIKINRKVSSDASEDGSN